MLDKHPFIFVCEHPVISSIINLAQKQTNKKQEKRGQEAQWHCDFFLYTLERHLRGKSDTFKLELFQKNQQNNLNNECLYRPLQTSSCLYAYTVPKLLLKTLVLYKNLTRILARVKNI